jgi:hypothetical protein
MLSNAFGGYTVKGYCHTKRFMRLKQFLTGGMTFII